MLYAVSGFSRRLILFLAAALMLAQTYDPTVLGTQDIRNITPDPALARSWYQRAAQLGSADAQRRLSQLQ